VIVMGSDLMSLAFQWDCDEFLQRVFLELDPYSLKTGRKVCSQWNEYISKRVWKSRRAQKRLHKRLDKQFVEEEPCEVEFQVSRGGEESQAFYCAADESVLVCGLLNGTANVYEIKTNRLLAVLDCQSSGAFVQLSVGKDFVVAVSSYGIVSVWEKTKFSLIFRENVHENSTIQGIKAMNDIFITGDVDGSINAFKVRDKEVAHVLSMVEEKNPVNHLDFDGKWILTGSRNTLKIWNLFDEKDWSKTLKTGYICCCCLSYPLAASAGVRLSKGVKIWDLRKGTLLVAILEQCFFWSLDLQGNYLAAAMSSNNQKNPQIHLIDMSKVTEGESLVRSLPCEDRATVLNPHICSNTSKIIEAHGSVVRLREFWNYQVSDWDCSTFLKDIKL